jgi:hypothetical protein
MTTQPEAFVPFTGDATMKRATIDDRRAAHVPDRLVLIVRIVWLIHAIVIIGLLVFAFPQRYADYAQICVEETCAWWQLSSAALDTLQKIGLSSTAYQVYGTLLEFISVLTFMTVALLIFWRKWSQWIVLLVSQWLLTFGTSDVLLTATGNHIILQQVASIYSYLRSTGFCCKKSEGIYRCRKRHQG